MQEKGDRQVCLGKARAHRPNTELLEKAATDNLNSKTLTTKTITSVPIFICTTKNNTDSYLHLPKDTVHSLQ
jgi:hypothetical protein